MGTKIQRWVPGVFKMNKYLLWFINIICLFGSIVVVWTLTNEYQNLGLDLYSMGILIWTAGLMESFIIVLSLVIYRREKNEHKSNS